MDLKGLIVEKKQLLKRLKEVVTNLGYIEKEIEVLSELAKKAQEYRVDSLMRARRKLEYKITSAPHARAERKYLNKLKEIEKKLEEYRPYLEARKRLKILEAQYDALKVEKEELEKQIEELNGKIEQAKKEKRREKRKAAGGKPVVEEFTTLESLVEIEEE